MSQSASTITQRLGAEFIGTFALVFAGCGAIMVDAASAGSITHVGVSLTFGLTIMVMVYACGHISGAHFNPAVTIAFGLVGAHPWKDAPAYISAQCLGSICAVELLSLALGSTTTTTFGETLPVGGVVGATTAEVVTSFFLMFVISAVALDKRSHAQMSGVAIGGVVALCALFAGPISGASMNPARSLGPALFSGSFDSLWIYVAAPVVGTSLAAISYRALSRDRSRADRAV